MMHLSGAADLPLSISRNIGDKVGEITARKIDQF